MVILCFIRDIGSRRVPNRAPELRLWFGLPAPQGSNEGLTLSLASRRDKANRASAASFRTGREMAAWLELVP